MKNPQERFAIYQLAFTHFGASFQAGMLTEECIELAQELLEKEIDIKVVGEITDVLICIEEFNWFFVENKEECEIIEPFFRAFKLIDVAKQDRSRVVNSLMESLLRLSKYMCKFRRSVYTFDPESLVGIVREVLLSMASLCVLNGYSRLQISQFVDEKLERLQNTINNDIRPASGAMDIMIERNEQIAKHGYTLDYDKSMNNIGQLPYVAKVLLDEVISPIQNLLSPPKGWSQESWKKLILKPYRKRLVIAGAFIAAEIDRLK